MRTPINRLKLYRRHIEGCKAKSDLDCSCPIWAYGHVRGKPFRKSLDTRDLTTAERRIKTILGETEEAAPQVEQVTIEYAIQNFLSDRRGRDCAPNTIEHYTRDLKQFQKFVQARGISDVASIQPAHVRDLVFQAYGPMKPRTKNSKLRNLKAWLSYCEQQLWIQKSPAFGIKPVKVSGYCRTALTVEQVSTILSHIDGLEEPQRGMFRALFLLLIYSGLRISDAWALRRTDLDFETGILGPIEIIKTKQEFEIELHPEAIQALSKLPNTGPRFFDNRRSWDTSYHWINDHFSRLMSKALGQRVTPHWLRDTFAMRLIENGVDIFLVSQLLGHSNVKVTQERYVSRKPKERLTQAIRQLSYDRPRLKRVS